MSTKEQRFARDILTTVVESPAIVYWAKGVKVERDGAGYVTSATIAVLDETGGAERTIDEKTIWLGFRRVANEATQLNRTLRGVLLAAHAEKYSGNVDATGADVLVQLGLFGEIVYG